MSTHPAADRVSVDDHRARVAALLADVNPTDTETVSVEAALGRRLAAAVSSPIALPPFRNAQMDGIAVRASDLEGARALPVVGTIAAAPGAVPPLAPGTAVRIMTGAPVPEGADAVVAIEHVTIAVTDAGETAAVDDAPLSGAFIREAGGDLPAGGEVLAAGTVVASRHIAALAATGIDRVDVMRRIRLAVISTGAELAPAGAVLAAGQIFDANGPALAAAGRAAGCEIVLQQHTSDEADDFSRALATAAEFADVVVTAGGISQGEFEVVREVLEPHGAWVGSLALQPGGPQATARVAGVPVLCFPGNPVSAQLSFELFLAPLLREVAGLPARAVEVRRLTVDLPSVADRVQLVRARAIERNGITPVAGPGSHLVVAMAHADRVIVVPAETTHLPAGSEVTAWVL